jgi:hypothetical protein
VALLVLVITDCALVALAFRPDTAPAQPMSSGPDSVPVSPSTTQTPEVSAVPLRQVVVGIDERRAWRAVLGTCERGGAAIEVTGDGGRTWGSRSTPARALGRVQPVSPDRAFVIGADTRCRVGEFITDDGARTWDGPRVLDGAWSRTPGGDSSTAVTPARRAARPCGDRAVVDLARVSARSARVLCADGAIVTSSDGGARWTVLARVPGALAMSVREEQGSVVTVVVRLADGCAGVEVARVAGAAATPLTCLTTSDAVPQGRVAISVIKAAGWLVVGDTTWLSGPDLRTWSPAA